MAETFLRTDGHAPRALRAAAVGIVGGRAVRTGPASAFAAELHAVDAAEVLEDAWRDLARRALEPNVFFEPGFAIPAARHLTDDGRPQFLFIWDAPAGDGSRRLVGLFPLVIPRKMFGAGRIRVWKTAFSGFGVPLVDESSAPAVLAKFFAWVREALPKAGAVLFPGTATEGAFGMALEAYAGTCGLFTWRFGQHQRAVLRPGLAPVAFMAETVRAKKAKELRRIHRRLAEKGVLTERRISDRKGIRDAFEHFLALEASGWKSDRRSAMMQSPDVAAFARAAVRLLAARRACRIDVIELDGRPIAAGVLLISGGRSWYWKTAYDRDLARYSPGVLLTLALTRRQLESRRTTLTDSCAIADHPMIDHFWHERMAIADVLVAADPDNGRAGEAVARRERVRRGLRRRLKSIYLTFTGRHAS